MSERRFEAGPGFVRARECPGCGHTRCGEGCTCNCDAARAEVEAPCTFCEAPCLENDEGGAPTCAGCLADIVAHRASLLVTPGNIRCACCGAPSVPDRRYCAGCEAARCHYCDANPQRCWKGWAE